MVFQDTVRLLSSIWAGTLCYSISSISLHRKSPGLPGSWELQPQFFLASIIRRSDPDEKPTERPSLCSNIRFGYRCSFGGRNPCLGYRQVYCCRQVVRPFHSWSNVGSGYSLCHYSGLAVQNTKSEAVAVFDLAGIFDIPAGDQLKRFPPGLDQSTNPYTGNYPGVSPN